MHILAVRKHPLILETKLGINYSSNMFCTFTCIAERVLFGNFEVDISYPAREELAIEANKHIRRAQSQHTSLPALVFYSETFVVA